ncbi:DUF6164 family protein [Alloalcanivorax mobilis]|uniref:DUF6164 family protein n=1 Tax=Alloalcanivorax mobilis TaxID=2019569 RepID=UPI000C792DDB|nr:DUF6164 family protein [Alloalcanivorax mobilis]
MSKLLMNLRRVPDDELQEVRALLEAHRIDVYETEPSVWGISGGGLWLRDEAQQQHAQTLLGDYQRERKTRMRQAFDTARAEGRAPSLRDHPLRTVVFAVAVVVVLLISVVPFLTLG